MYKFYLYVRWPVTLGVLLALAILVFRPDIAERWGFATKNPQGANGQHAQQQKNSYALAVNRAAPAVVNIYTLKEIKNRRHPLLNDPFFRRFFNSSDIPGQKRLQSAMGSGVIVNEKGYILTNNHVVQGVDEIVVALHDGREAKAELKGVNHRSDLAVLKIDLDNLTPASIGDVDNVRVGDVVLAIGNPFGLGQTVTQGIISATGRRGLNISIYENFIQTDAAINPGNSGGALIDAQGNLLGINTANLDQSQSGYTGGIGFAIPADKAMQTLQDIVEFGRVVRGWLGVHGRPLTPRAAQSLNLRSTNGIFISSIDRDGPADKAGLKPGDIIMRINDQLVGSGHWGEQEIAESRPGDTVSIEFIREGKVQVIQAVLGSQPLIRG